MSPPKPKILVIDDEPVCLTLLSEYLTDSGYEAMAINKGLEAWEILSKAVHNFSVIILDRLMPDLDGMTLLERIKKHSLLRAIPVIMLTSNANKEEVIAAVKGGIYDFLLKPIDKELLILVIQRALRDCNI